MQALWRFIPVSLRRDMVVGGVAGFVAGLLFWWAIEAQSMSSTVSGLLGLDLSGAQLGLHLLVAIPMGATFGAISHYKAQGYATTVSCGTLYGLL